MELKLAIAYLKKQAKINSLDEIMKLELLEELLAADKLNKYLALKQKVQSKSKAHIRKFKYLYPEFLKDKISELDMELYFGNFEPNQNIKYYRDYFGTTKESENYTPKGSTVELKAYGESLKINREVISFVGTFKESLLQSFTDKTSESTNYVSNKFTEIDFYTHNLKLIQELINHDALEVLSPAILFNITYNQAETFELLHKTKKLNLLNPEQIYSIAKNHNRVFRYLVQSNDLDVLSKDTIIEIVDAYPKSIQAKLTKLKKAVTEKAFLYDPQNIFYFKNYDIESSFTSGLNPVKFKDDYSSYFSLNDIINNLLNDLNSESYYRESKSWSNKEIGILNSKYSSKFQEKIDELVAEIYKISSERIGEAKKSNKKNKTIGCITFSVIIIIVIALFIIMFNV